ncbi:tetratricopeptide repeat protein [Pseudomonas akapageensis]|uniref:tetratricopeptide repeat protein n=1 Tax=Pseudomonas akapageensis TaxID=2609961 RepID=UPI001408022C|nr:tetratricopeptide repeat protein [Pseudomonas akapageensis]
MQTKSLLPSLVLALCAAASLCSVVACAQSNNASTILIETASQQYEAGQLDQAAASLERALQIQPNNPATLHYLGVLRLQQGQYQQAEALAMRSNLQVGRNVQLRNRNIQLIQAAQKALAPNTSPSAEEIRIAALQAREAKLAWRREADTAVVLQSAPETEQAAADLASAQAEWGSEAQTVGGPHGEGELQMTSSEPEYEFDESDIPRGHWPPPGKCRIWFPDRPPGHQPKPGSCKKLKHRVPYGAYLVRG